MHPNGTFVRRLRAIAVIDVAGYSRLMGQDEGGTHARVNDLFKSVVEPAIASCGGKKIERAGDGLLVLFESSTDAVRCALAIQRETSRNQQGIGTEHKLQLRIGVNVGDIIIDADEIAGDDVNIAARLQALSRPGGVCISAAVKEQLHEDLGASYHDLGAFQLKNIRRSLRAFEARKNGPHHGVPADGMRRARWTSWRGKPARTGVAAAFAASLVVASLSLRWWPAGDAPSATDSPPMSVAVAAFQLSSTAPAESEATELTEAVTRGLAATGWLRVTAPDVSRRITATEKDLALVGRSLKVRYLVSGSVSLVDNRMQLNIELINTATGVSSWNGNLRTNERVSTLRGLAQGAVVMLREAVYAAERKRLVDSGANPRTPMEHKMLGDLETETEYVTLQSERRARAHYEQALQLDPNFVPALISVGYTLLSELDIDAKADHTKIGEQIDRLSKRVASLDPEGAPSWQFRSEVLARQWRWDGALDASDKALALDPGRAFAYGHRASLLIRLGQPAEALVMVERALTLADQRSGFALFQRCRAHMALGNYRAAAESCQKSLAREDGWLQHAQLLAAYALLDDDEHVRIEKATLEKALPGLTIWHVKALRESNVFRFEQQQEVHLLRGLRKAGVSEGSE